MGMKLNTGDLMPGSESWWHKKMNPGDAMPTRTRGGGYAPAQGAGMQPFQPLGENELEELQNAPQEPNQPIKNVNEYSDKAKAEAQKVAAERAGGEVNPVPQPVDRHDRGSVDESKADPDKVKEKQEALGLDGGSTVAARGTVEAAPTYGGYDDILKMMKANAVSDAELARRQHNREVVAGLGDMISAIANMWATTKGAPSSYDNSKGMSATAQDRYAKMLAQRKAQRDQIMNYYRVKKTAEQEKENQEYRNSMLEIRRQEAERRQNESDAKIKREDDIAKARQNALEAQQRKNDAETIKKRGENQYAITYWSKYGEYRQTMDHEEADRRANEDAAAAEQEVLNKKEQREERKTVAVETRANKTGSSKGKKGKQHTGKKGQVYGPGKSKKKLYNKK